MGQQTTIDATRSDLRRFAQHLRDVLGAERVLLFGSHARGTASPDSDYDFIVVADHFATIPRLRREHGLHDLFYEVVGVAPLDFLCLTPEEFDQTRHGATLISAVLPEAIDLLPAQAKRS